MYIISALIFLLAYVWQNIEIMKIKLEYRKSVEQEKTLIKMNDRLKYEIEKLKRLEVVEKKASEAGMRKLTENDFVSIEMK